MKTFFFSQRLVPICILGTALAFAAASRLDGATNDPFTNSFASQAELAEMLAYQKREHTQWGETSKRKFFLTNVPSDGSGPSIMQRSGRKRLYDHNIILRAMYSNQVIHVKDGSLGPIFEDAIFVDIGSAILNGEGAPTCRDLYEDENVFPFLHRLVATDINDSASRYVDIYFKSNNNLPFPVRPVALELDSVEKMQDMVRDRKHPLMLRSANSGPDLYYSPELLSRHFKAVVDYAAGRPLLYFFGRFILYKSKNLNTFEIIGEMDRDIGFNHRSSGWLKIDWTKRTVGQAVLVREDRLRLPQ